MGGLDVRRETMIEGVGVVDVLRQLAPPSSYEKANPLEVRRLACARVLREIEACLAVPMGEPLLAAWFEGEGREWLEMAGLGHLATLHAGELARRVFEHAPTAFEAASHRCANCALCVRINGNGRVRCEMGVWEERGKNADYAINTVRGSADRFEACEFFEMAEDD